MFTSKQNVLLPEGWTHVMCTLFNHVEEMAKGEGIMKISISLQTFLLLLSTLPQFVLLS